MDALSDILRHTHLKACVYFKAGFCAPWGMNIPNNDAAQFHLIEQGSCHILYLGEEQVLSSGDIVVFPYGSSHQLFDGEPKEFLNGIHVMQSIASNKAVFQQGKVTTQIMCGHFEIDRSFSHPLFNSLPEMMIVRNFNQEASGAIKQLTKLVLNEQKEKLSGSIEIVTRLAESLFIYILRIYSFRETSQGFLAAISDERLQKALQIIHSNELRDLSLDNLAKQAGMSRSAFAEKFKTQIGQSPMKYASNWQLLRARKSLLATNKPISIIAEESGYTSDAAFSRAFKLYLGVSPSELRSNSSESKIY